MQTAQTYLTRWGWGAHGKSLGITRMFQDADVGALKSLKAVAALRPRGVLSGFLVICPATTTSPCVCAFIPPVTSKLQPFLIRMRLDPVLQKEGAIFSAYSDNGDLIIEDVLVWRSKSVFQTTPFDERWRLGGKLLELWEPDADLEGCGIRFTEYVALTALPEPADRQVVEFVPIAANMKRMVWVPTETAATTTWIAKREALVGPDIFTLWSDKGEKQAQLALVRTLAVSKILRLHTVDEFRVNATWNKMFERWEILGIV